MEGSRAQWFEEAGDISVDERFEAGEASGDKGYEEGDIGYVNEGCEMAEYGSGDNGSEEAGKGSVNEGSEEIEEGSGDKSVKKQVKVLGMKGKRGRKRFWG